MRSDKQANLGPDRFLSGTAGVMSGVGANWAFAERCPWMT
jgi:hypothetical protein